MTFAARVRKITAPPPCSFLLKGHGNMGDRFTVVQKNLCDFLFDPSANTMTLGSTECVVPVRLGVNDLIYLGCVTRDTRHRLTSVVIACIFSSHSATAVSHILVDCTNLREVCIVRGANSKVNNRALVVLGTLASALNLRRLVFKTKGWSLASQHDRRHQILVGTLTNLETLTNLSIQNCHLHTDTFQLLVQSVECLPNLRGFLYQMYAPEHWYSHECDNVTPSMTGSLLRALHTWNKNLLKLSLIGFDLGREALVPFLAILSDKQSNVKHLRIATYPRSIASNDRCIREFATGPNNSSLAFDNESVCLLGHAISANMNIVQLSLPFIHITFDRLCDAVTWRNQKLGHLKLLQQINPRAIGNPILVERAALCSRGMQRCYHGHGATVLYSVLRMCPHNLSRCG